MPDIDWEFKVIKGVQSNLRARGISDRTALILGISAIVALVVVALAIAAMVILR